MGGKLLKLSPDEGDGTETNRPLISYREVFEEHFPYYLAIGMSAKEYWHGDCQMVRHYRKADTIRQKRTNQELWLQGMYIYEALCDASPLLNGMSKRQKPFPYPDSPYRSKEPEKKQPKREQERQKMLNDKAKFEVMAARINAKFNRQKSGE